MKHFYEFRAYIPDEINYEGALYLVDRDGQDWYACQAGFREQTWKITYNDAGIICSCSQDVSSLWPAGLNVAEIPSLPDDFRVDGTWRYDGNRIFHQPPVGEGV